MDRALLNLFILIAVLAFGIFFGVDMAKNGIEQVNGPIGSAKDLTVDKMAEEQQNLVIAHNERMRLEAEKELIASQERDQKIELDEPRTINQSLLSRFFHKIGDLLSWLADSIIRIIVNAGRSIFT